MPPRASAGCTGTACDQPLLDTSKPNIARVYDYWLGGKDNFQADREEAGRLMAIYPPMAKLAQENRQFLSRAVGWLAEQGIRQFLDIGSGLPTTQNTHQAAQAVDGSCRVVYADNDPVVVNHAKVLLSGPGVGVITGDLREPGSILDHPVTRQLIRPGERAGLIIAFVLHFLDAGTASKIMREYARRLAAGSYLVISVGLGDPQTGEALAREYTAAALYNHSPGLVAGFFDGLDIIGPPGLVDARNWHPGQRPAPAPGARQAGRVLAGVARKQGSAHCSRLLPQGVATTTRSNHVPDMASTADPAEAEQSREAMTDKLIAGGWITSPAVEAAFRSVPRHEFVPPGTSLADAYGAMVAPVTKKDEHGADLSSVSAPWLQARMIAQAGIEPGMSVLEVGSGGYNAALLAEVTGKEGRVVSIDIDPDVTGRATAALAATGYADRVTVVTGDSEHGVPEHAPYDAVIVTVGAWDVAPAWTSQLTVDGALVVPLRMNTITRSLGFRRAGSHLVSTSAEPSGFVPIQGTGGRPERTFQLPGPSGGHVALRFDQDAPADPSLLDWALATAQVTAWSGIKVGDGESFADLNLWLAGFLPGFCRVAASEGTALHAEGVNRSWFPFGGVLGGSFACLALRKLDGPGPAEFEFGAKAYGKHARAAASAVITEIRAWDSAGRHLGQDAFTFWPAGSALPPPSPATAVFPKVHGTVTASWKPGQGLARPASASASLPLAQPST